MSPKIGKDEIDKLVTTLGSSPRAAVNLVKTLLLPQGDYRRAHDLLEASLAAAPDDAELHAMVTTLRGTFGSSWYFTMVCDENRHNLYQAALERVIGPDSLVLDIGAGTGLFAMIAARAGAKMVIGCEHNISVAREAQRIVQDNGLADRVRILPKTSGHLRVGRDLERRADVLIWDNLSNNLIGAGGLHSVDDARRRLLREGANIIPGRVELRVALVQNYRPEKWAMSQASGFDMTSFNRLRRSGLTIDREDVQQRSAAATLCEFDVRPAIPDYPGRCEIATLSRGGKVDGIVQWLRFNLDDEVIYDTSDIGATSFGYQFYSIPPLETRIGEPLRICGNNDGTSTWLWVER